MLGFTFGERKIAMKFDLSSFASIDSWLQFLEIPQSYSFTESVYVDLPHLITLVPDDSCLSTFVVFVRSTILSVLRSIRDAKIFATIVECITVPMVNLYRWISETENITMHQDGIEGSAARCSSVIRFRGFVPKRMPVANAEFIKFTGIDNGHFGMSEWNDFDRLILRLNNRLAVDALLGHDITSNDVAVFDRFSILPENGIALAVGIGV